MCSIAIVPRSLITLGVEPTLRGSLAQLANGRVLGRSLSSARCYELAARRNVEIVALPIETACRLIADLAGEVNAVLHVTC